MNGPQIQNFSGYNLSWGDGLALSRGDNNPDVPNEGSWTAAKMVEVDKEKKPFTTYLADRGSYTVQLGAHRIVMVDSSWDVGVVDNIVGAFLTWLGTASEDKKTFVGGSPNCEGVSDQELQMVIDTLDSAPLDALVIVALHAPLFNPRYSYPYFLRETQRPALGRSVEN